MKILFIYNTKVSWTQNDINLLSNHFIVKDIYIKSLTSTLISANPFLILKYDAVVFWFASLSYFPVFLISWILKKKIIIFAGGYDVAKVPDIRYGAFFLDSWLKKLIRGFMFKAADKICSVSISNQNEAIENAKIPVTKSVMIYHGFKNTQVPLKKFQDRNKQIVTIGGINNDTYLRKGHKYFLELSKNMPDWNFILVGKVSSDFLYNNEFLKCPNIKITGFLSDSQFFETLQESKFYLQLSSHEGFGCSIVDAALMGCYPIVFNRYAMPEVVEDCGTVVKFLDLKSVERIINELEYSDIDVENIKVHYLNKFSEYKREAKLVELISSLNNDN